MAEYIEREAAVMKIREWFWSAPGVHPKLDRDAAEDILFAIPAADVVLVRRRGECKHWFDNGTDLCSCDRDALLRRRDFFCADGERKDGDGYGV